MARKWKKWSPPKLREWVESIVVAERFPRHLLDFYHRLATDDRMRPVWEWLESVGDSRPSTSAFSFAHIAYTSLHFPSKPGDMTPKQRAGYFEKVRSHAHALATLLQETKFDRNQKAKLEELSEETLDNPLEKEVQAWGDDEDDEGHVVAFQVTPHGVFRLPWDYPNSHFLDLLQDVIEWTTWDDGWDDSIYSSSLPVVQMNAPGARPQHFACMFSDRLERPFRKLAIPFAHLATVVNVALDLKAGNEVDEETVRKQVRRYQAKKKKKKNELAPEVDEPATGQKHDGAQISVLPWEDDPLL